MNPRALACYWFLTVVTMAIALSFPAFVWIPLAAFVVYFISSLR